MTRYWLRIDALLRARRWMAGAPSMPRDATWLALQVILFGAFYGSVMGTFSGFHQSRLLQVVYSGTKVPLLLLVTFAVSLPSFFVLNTLFGLRDDFGPAVRALLATQAGLTVILAALAPFTALWYASSADYREATAFNGLMFAVATISAQGLLRHYYRPLIERHARHRWLLRTWLVVYAFVGIQMAWVLRPFIGDPQQPLQFFRDEAWGNAYVVVAQLLWGLVSK